MDREWQRQWDARHRAREGWPEPSRVLAENAHLLPATGEALDLACGLGSDALLLAARGLRVHGWDFSPVALERLRARAAAQGLSIETELRDVVAAPPPANAFDLINVSHFLERSLAPALAVALRPGGLLCYQTFTRSQPPGQCRGPDNPAFRLAENELLGLFVPPLRLLVYREESLAGDRYLGWRGMALLVARKPAASPEETK